MTRGVARLGDLTYGRCRFHGQQAGKIVTASADINANGRGVARLGDLVRADCGHTSKIMTASTNTDGNARGIARLGDITDGDPYDAKIVTGSTDTEVN